jgi:hypothetical protein
MSTDRPETAEGIPIGGWVLRTDVAGFDPGPMLAEYGQVFRYPIPASDRAELMVPGQPCFLWRSDRSKVVGIWGVGEVVAPTFSAPVDPDDPSAGEQLFAEVEILALEKPIAVGKLAATKGFEGSEVLADDDRADPVVLRPAEVRAIEEFDFTIVEPTDQQLARLDELLGDDDGSATVGHTLPGTVFELVGVEGSFGIRIDDAGDDLLSVFTVDAAGDAFELGRFAAFTDALDLVALRCGDLELADPVGPAPDDELPDGDPIAVLRTEDGSLAIFRTGDDTFELYDPEPLGPDDDEDADDDWDDWDDDRPRLLGRYDTVTDALAALADAIDEVDED